MVRGADGSWLGGTPDRVVQVWPSAEVASASAIEIRTLGPSGGLLESGLFEVGNLAGILRQILRPSHDASAGGWIVALAYELGRMIEPTACARPQSPSPDQVGRCRRPLLELHRFDAPQRAARPQAFLQPTQKLLTISRVRSTMGRDAYQRGVERIIEYIRAGDIFQANLAHAIEADFSGDPAAFALSLLAAADPRHGAVMVSPPDSAGETGMPRQRWTISASPELFLAMDPGSRRVRTRPMKGTRRAGPSGELDLDSSGKDRAELAMIVDLMRNDLGRVSTLGSVRVEAGRTIERHGQGRASLAQAVGEVTGTLRPDRDVIDLLWATFPPGSVTGAPKIRAMQIIDELEGAPRDAYCGSLGWIGDDGRVSLNVAIRTAMLDVSCSDEGDCSGRLRYPVGAGIVVESDTGSEWLETLAKAAVLESAIGRTLELNSIKI